MAIIKALGVVFKWNAVAVPQCKSVDGPGMSVDKADTSNMDTAGGKRTYLPTLVDGGQIKLEILYDPDDTVHKALIADGEAKTTRAFEIDETDPTPSTTAGNGFITAIELKRDFAGVLLMSVTIQVSGAVTHA